ALVLLCLALYVAVVLACDPDGNGKPDCSASNEGVKYRNFWDPTHYWQCENSVAQSVQCQNSTGFIAKSSSCVPWSEWEWVAPCPD
ncbi:hypothetical protein KR222_000483, partial [Zaprionus bogoriensis]